MCASINDWYSWDYNNQKFQTNYKPYLGSVGIFKSDWYLKNKGKNILT